MFNVIHARKIVVDKSKGWGGLADVAAHNSRENCYDEDKKRKLDEDGKPVPLPEYLNPDFSANPELMALQRTNQKEQLSAEVVRKRERLIAGLKRKPQKNAAEAIEFNISASPEFGGDWLAYLEDAEKMLRQKYGDENCIQSTIHADESTVHKHLLFVPILKGKDGERRYSSSEFLGGRDGLRQLQTEFWEKVGKKYELERGVEGSRARHGGAREFRQRQHELEKELEKLEAERKKLEEEKSKFRADRKRAIRSAWETRRGLKTSRKELNEAKSSLARDKAKFEAFSDLDRRIAEVASKQVETGGYTVKTNPGTLIEALKKITKGYVGLMRVMKKPLRDVEQMCEKARKGGCKNLLEYMNQETRELLRPKKRLREPGEVQGNSRSK
jgi:hypothetical protein